MHLISLAYEGHPITIRDDGWFNATEAAQKWGKRPVDWLRLDETTVYINAMAKALKVESKVSHAHFGLVTTSRGGKSPGTWMHPKLAVAFARWLDPQFSVWCDCQIDEIIRKTSEGDFAEYLPTYHALHRRVDDLAASSKNKQYVHINLNKLINNTVGIKTGERHGLPVPRKSLLIVAQAAATHAMEAANDHHDGYQLAKAAMSTIRPVAQQLEGQRVLQLS